MNFRVINKSENELPKYQTEGSAGMDVASNEDYILKAGKRSLISTGLFFEVLPGYEIQVRPRSGLAFKNGITVLNSPGTIDSDYRGELGVILYNTSEVDFEIKKGDRVAQLVIAPVRQISLIEVEELSPTGRGEAGFGSTNI